MNERDLIQRLLDILSELFASEDAEIFVDFPITLGNGLRRYFDILVISPKSGIYIFEIKDSFETISENYLRAKFFASQLVSQEPYKAYSQQVRFFLFFRNITRQQYYPYSDLDTLFPEVDYTGMVFLYIDDLASERFKSRIGQAPYLRFDGVNQPQLTSYVRKEYSVFISYRRTDSKWAAGRIADYLKNLYEPDEIFFDTLTLNWGEDFLEIIRKTINASNILLVIIGENWLKASYEESNIRRLDDTSDVVRFEVATALRNKLLVIPILIDDAKVPYAAYLPDELQLLSRKNAGRIRGDNFENDIQPLIKQLDNEGVKRRKGRKK